MSDRRFDAARQLIDSAQRTGAFPAGVIEVGALEGPVWQESFGTLTYDADAAATRVDTVFDLASLTKIICTTTLVMHLVVRGRLSIDDPVSRWIGEWNTADRLHVTIEDLLAHSSGLTGWLPYYRDHLSPRELARAIATLPLEYPPRSRAIYSDLGFILLGFVVEAAGGAPLDEQFGGIAAAWDLPIVFRPPAEWHDRTAPTETDPWRGRLLVGEVHDENAWALGGVAAHAGLFGSAPGVGGFARQMLAIRIGDPAASPLLSSAAVGRFTTRSTVPGSSRGLGWDMMLPTSSCGHHMSTDAFGHTGFTGTSLWIDPIARVYVVFLTNRVHPSRANTAIQGLRPAVHDAIMESL